MTPIEKMEGLETLLKALFESLQWIGNAESLELANEALKRLAELLAQEKLIAEIF